MIAVPSLIGGNDPAAEEPPSTLTTSVPKPSESTIASPATTTAGDAFADCSESCGTTFSVADALNGSSPNEMVLLVPSGIAPSVVGGVPMALTLTVTGDDVAVVGDVTTLNTADVDPSATVTGEVSVTSGRFVATGTTNPAGAGPFSTSVACV